jgi:hypothetical protein
VPGAMYTFIEHLVSGRLCSWYCMNCKEDWLRPFSFKNPTIKL